MYVCDPGQEFICQLLLLRVYLRDHLLLSQIFSLILIPAHFVFVFIVCLSFNVYRFVSSLNCFVYVLLCVY